MSEVYDSIMEGLQEALEDAKGLKKAARTTYIISVKPVKVYNADDVKRIRKRTGFSQALFAKYIGVSVKTVEAWEAGRNHPSGAASRLLSMMEMDGKLSDEYPFVKIERIHEDASEQAQTESKRTRKTEKGITVKA